MPFYKNQELSLRIESLSNDGNGVGRSDGMVVFVPNAAVGDLLRVKIVKVAKNHLYARAEEVIEAGHGRQAEDCSICRSCGGCDFRHLSYEAELQAKENFVRDALAHIGGFTDVPIQPILPSPQQTQYRNKVQYPVAADKDGAITWGFYAVRSHRVIPHDNCLLQPPLLNQIAAATAEILQKHGAQPYDEATQTGDIRHIALRQSLKNSHVLVCVVCTCSVLMQEDYLVQELTARFPQIATIIINHNPKHTNVIYGRSSRTVFGPGYIEDTLCGVPMRLNEHTFAQVNAPAAAQLFGVVQNLLQPSAQDILLDLYCGTGVIGLSMANKVKELIGVEIVPEAIESARFNSTTMGLTNTRFYCESADTAARRLANEKLQPTLITLDPPRKGSDAQTLAAVLQMAPQKIAMVSCNPATMARDLAALVQGGYRLTHVQPADFFPRTKHVECASLLLKEN